MNPKQISHRQRESGDFIVDGELCQGPEGNKFWRVVVTSPTSGRVKDRFVDSACLVRGDELRCVEIGVAPPDFEVVSGRPVPILEPSMKAAITEAIRCWELEER